LQSLRRPPIAISLPRELPPASVQSFPARSSPAIHRSIPAKSRDPSRAHAPSAPAIHTTPPLPASLALSLRESAARSQNPPPRALVPSCANSTAQSLL